MKTTVYFAIISFIFLFSSCAEDPQFKIQGDTDYSVELLSKYNESELTMVYSALDSLNQSLIRKNRVSRGFIK